MNRTAIAWTAAVAYVGTVVAANAAIQHFVAHPLPGMAPGLVPVGFGLSAPAGVWFVGLALVLRDLVQWALRKPGETRLKARLKRLAIMLALIACGAGLSYLVAAPRLATASAVAFGVSEMVDFGLFTWVAPRWSRAVLAGGLAGTVLDSAVFLWLAFGSLAFLPGQVVGKSYGIIAAAVLIAVRRRRTASA